MGILQTLTAIVALIFALCVVAQAAQEVIKSLMDTKASTMRQIVIEFMGRHLTLEQVTGALATRGLDITDLEHFSKDDFRHLLDGIDLAAPQVEGVVKSGEASIDAVKNNIAGAYEGARAKFQKIYTRKNKIIAVIISFLVVILLNANLLLIYEQVSTDQVMAQAIVGHAGQTTCPEKQSPQDQPPATQANTPPEQNLKDVYKNNRTCISQIVKEYPILFRWKQEEGKPLLPMYLTHEGDGGAFKVIIGLLSMALLVSLGTPFWNDVLKGVTGVNNTLNGGLKKNGK